MQEGKSSFSFTNLYARMRIAAGEKSKLAEFGLRRAQGPCGGIFASRYAVMGGFHSSSNVLASSLFNLNCIGTMAHSYVTAFSDLDEVKDFEINGKNVLSLTLKWRKQLGYEHTNDSELASFITFAWTFPHKTVLLVDTYNTVKSGVPNFCCVALALSECGYKIVGLRLDSGDLAELSK